LANLSQQKAQIVKDAIRRFNHLPNRTIARHILHTYGELFDNDLEVIRTRIRYYTGKQGVKNKARVTDQSLFRATPKLFPPTWRKVRTPYILDPGLWGILSDAHIPFHEPQALQIAVDYLKTEGCTGIFINGDWQDCASISYWPTVRRRFHEEIGLVIDSFDWLRGEFPKAKIVYKPGNHEYRLPRKFIAAAPELVESPLAAMETVIGFEERKIEFLDYYQIVKAGDLPIIHGHEVQNLARTVNPARGLFLRAKNFAACSHCHTTSQHSERDINGNLLTTWSFGCLCDLSPDYSPIGNNWNWGFGLVEIRGKGDFEVQNLRILPNGKVR
jgi:predicted phosphodiesterase